MIARLCRSLLLIGCTLLLMAVCSPAKAAGDEWFGRDKPKHLTHSAAAGVVCAAALRNDSAAFWCAMAPGALKEAYDAGRGRGVSGKDLAWDAVGAYAGLRLGRGLQVRVRRGGGAVIWRTEF